MARIEMNLNELFARAVGEFDARVQQVKPDQWHAPTPCAEWDVHALVNHVVNEARWVKPLLDGKTIEEVGDSLDGDLLGDDPIGAWERARDEELVAVEGLESLDKTVNVSWGQISAAEYLPQMLLDHVVHGWDVAKAVGGDQRLDPELVEVCLGAIRPMEEVIRGSGSFGDRVDIPEGADAQTELLAILGRKA